MQVTPAQIVDQLLEVDVKSMLSRAMTPENIGRELVRLAAEVAELVLPIFERDYAEDDRPRKAIEAAKAWLADPSDENFERANRASDTANRGSADLGAPTSVVCAAWSAVAAADAVSRPAPFSRQAAVYAAKAAEVADTKTRTRVAEIRERIEYLRDLANK